MKAGFASVQKELEDKLTRCNEQLSQRSLESAELAARNRRLEEENSQLRRSATT